MYTPAKKPVHLVKNLHEVPAKKVKSTMFGSEKHDGVFTFLREGLCYSRTGKRYQSGDPLAESAFRMMPDHVVLGEFMVYDSWGVPRPVNEISGDFRRDERCDEAFLVVHDLIPTEDFDAGFCETPFMVRIDQSAPLYELSRFIENYQTVLHGMDAYISFAQEFIDQDLEGAVFKQVDGTWTAGKKNEVQMKIKGEVSFDLRVNGLIQGNGKYEGTLGALSCAFKRFGKPDGEPVNIVCSGMTDKQRDFWWKNMHQVGSNNIIGQIVKVDGMCITPDGMIREPRFKEVREDKLEADL